MSPGVRLPQKPNRRRNVPSWGETVFALTMAVILGGIALGAVWTRIEEFETGKWDGPAITQTIVLGLFLIALVLGLWRYLARRVND